MPVEHSWGPRTPSPDWGEGVIPRTATLKMRIKRAKLLKGGGYEEIVDRLGFGCQCRGASGRDRVTAAGDCCPSAWCGAAAGAVRHASAHFRAPVQSRVAAFRRAAV